MTIEQSLKETINNAFKHTQFIDRTQEAVEKMLRTKVHGSDTVTLFPTFDKLETITEHTWKIHFGNFTLDCKASWKKTDTHWVFTGVE